MNSTNDQKQIKLIKNRIDGAVYRVVNILGSRFSNEIYCNALTHELIKMGCNVQVDYKLDIYYDGIIVGTQSVDLLVDDLVLVVIQGNNDTHTNKTLRHFLMATGQRLGVIICFKESKPKFEYVSYKL